MVSSFALSELINSGKLTLILESENAELLNATEDIETNVFRSNLKMKKGEYLAMSKTINGTCESLYSNRTTKGDFQKCMAAYRRYSGIMPDLPPTVTKKQSNNNIRENEVAKAMFFYDIIDRILLDSVSAEYFTADEAMKAVIEIMEEFPTYMNIYFSDFEREDYNNEN